MEPRPFFIVGCGRSGTSLLRGLLSHHPDVAIPLESLFVIDYLRKADAFTSAELKTMIVEEPELLEWGLEVKRADLKDCNTIGEIILRLHMLYAQMHGKRRWGNKTPRFVRWLDLLHSHFPEARFVHMIRDPRAVASSLIRSDVHRSTAWHSALRWNRDVTAGLDFESRFPSLVLRIRYEELVDAPVLILTKLSTFTGLNLDISLIDAKPESDEYSAFYENIHANLQSGITNQFVDRWKDDLDLQEIRVVEATCSPLMAKLGYPVTTTWEAVPVAVVRRLKLRRLSNLFLQTWRYLRFRRHYLIHLFRRKWRLGLLGEFLRGANY